MKKVIIIGGGPAGYAAGLYASHFDLEITLIESDAVGGTCLNRGCIPAKHWLHVAEVNREIHESEEIGINVGNVTNDWAKTSTARNGVIKKLTGGVTTLLESKNVKIVEGWASVVGKNTVLVKKPDGVEEKITADYIMLATGSVPRVLQGFDFDNDFPPAPDGTPASEDFFTGMPSKCAVGNILYSWNYAYNSDNVKGTPRTIKDFFNTGKFPGKRAIYKGALTNLEIALAADGVRMGDGGARIYKQLDTERGVKRAMDKIKKLCTDPKGGCVFWSAGAQPPELLMSGEVVMATGWNGRFFNATIGEGAPIVQVWDAQGLDYEYFALVKGGPNEADAKKALAEMTSTEMLAGSAKYIAYAPWRKSSIAVMEAGEPWYKDGKTNMVPHMPTAPKNLKNYFLVNADFWADNGTELGEQWEAMKAGL